MAAGSPVRPFMVALFTPYNLLVLAFAWGIWAVAGPRRAALATAAFLAASAVVGQLALLLFPMDLRGAEETTRGALHGPATIVMSCFTLLAIGFAASLLSRRFRWYSYGTIVTLVVFGLLTSLSIPAMADGRPTPWTGVVERVSIYAQMLWTAVLAVSLWRAGEPAGSREVVEK
jgi:hypothetical protein